MKSAQPRSQVACDVLLAVLFFAPPVHAKSQQPEVAGWQPISKEEWALNDDPTNPGASALILYREITTDDMKSVETHSYRIKILTDEGKKYADVQIPYLEKEYRIEGIRARTVEPDGTAVEFSGEVFDKLVAKAKKVQFQAKTFTLAGVRPGCIIEYSYQTRWHENLSDALKSSGQYMSDAYAILTARWMIPEDLFTRRARFSLRPLLNYRLMWDTMGLPKDTQPHQQGDGSVLLELTNVPAFTEEPFMPPERMVKSRADFFYVIGDADPSIFWRSQGKQTALFFEKFIGPSKNIQRVANETVAAGDSPETKLRKLYARAQQVRFVNSEPAKTEKEEKRENLKDNNDAEDVLKHGYAFANEIDLLFVALARAAGFESAPVLQPVTGRFSGRISWTGRSLAPWWPGSRWEPRTTTSIPPRVFALTTFSPGMKLQPAAFGWRRTAPHLLRRPIREAKTPSSSARRLFNWTVKADSRGRCTCASRGTRP